jgi:PII-like signaling protein
MSETNSAVQVTIYLNEADEWQRRPLHLELLKYLREQEIPGATVLHAVAGFTGHSRVKTSTLVDAGGKLPLMLTFIDKEEHVDRVLPKIKEMAGHRLIVREKVVIESEAE